MGLSFTETCGTIAETTNNDKQASIITLDRFNIMHTRPIQSVISSVRYPNIASTHPILTFPRTAHTTL